MLVKFNETKTKGKDKAWAMSHIIDVCTETELRS